VPFTYSDLQGSKRRPACVVSPRSYNDRSPDVVLAMVTSSGVRMARPEPGDVVITDWQAAGLLLPSVVRAARLLAVEKRIVGRALGDLTPVDLNDVDKALRVVLGL
jgi:mRNA interferase MazF